MATHYEHLALKFAPELYYVRTNNALRNIWPQDLGGIYWRAVPSSVRWADVCIQYIVYFTEQRWVSSILDKFLDIIPGNHPNDYAPIFLYLRDGKPVRVVFDICHYEAVGAINSPSPVLPLSKGPLLKIKNFYRGFSTLDDCTGHNCFFCKKPIEGEGVQWDETNNWVENPEGEGLIHIYLHGDCSVRLGERLIGDGFPLQDWIDREKLDIWIDARLRHG